MSRRKPWLINSGLGEVDCSMPYSLDYLHEGHGRFGYEFPLSGDDMRHALAGAPYSKDTRK